MNDVDADRNRLRWQCRRGMLELDELLLNYLQNDFAASPPEQQASFRALLALEDPLLHRWLLAGVEAPAQWQAVVTAIKACARA